ncbi:glycoside hydrolase 5 family protein [Cellvibrio japonicus]|uniref:mannan endo-1,4-beta-mannosidase n=1 Tax=Cellvibrio japonicus (strain Ueda107) TaxID=498211 RepID=B3PIQ2_CELJU|nr:fibronectin type III domain-containing protein [Cellvibrio japonicus]ACE84240.1 endo-beta-mannanase, putative, man5E [Cellvibrio japonicus Ueda107]QEI13967.1 beta-mannanase man5E [Cellvibrio japonicus]QEI17541.1 beta-mannanase man5E [Cellvibrio japonicus]QEI21117.1 beta-mannanase man5E [Cellvibrio japonicus]
MKKLFFFLLCLGVGMSCHAHENFITRQDHQLFDGKKLFRFAGIQFPELHRIEDDSKGVCHLDPRGWGQFFKWPTADEQENWIKSLVHTGHKAMRVYVLSIEQEFDHACNRQTHIMKPATPNAMPRLNPIAMEHYDRMIALSDKYGLRLILPIVDHWPWWGGREQLAAFYGEKPEDFYNTNSKTFKAYLNIIEQLLTRKNTITGREYRDEKAIMAWETGNELQDTTADFLRITAAHIKNLDKNHLVVDGTYKKINEFALNDPNVDIISNHYYENAGNLSPSTVTDDLTAIKGKKAYLIGEFGLLSSQQLEEIMNAAVDTKINGASAVGAFIWGGRGRRHNGGFYWHLEPANNKTYSYHLPGFADGDANEEITVVNMVRHAIARMDGEKAMRPLPIPEAPLLRTIFSEKNIQWLGSSTGRHYTVERAENPKGPWKVIGKNISDGKNKFNPDSDSLFSDSSKFEAGKEYFYRVTAVNETGVSHASNIQSFKR